MHHPIDLQSPSSAADPARTAVSAALISRPTIARAIRWASLPAIVCLAAGSAAAFIVNVGGMAVFLAAAPPSVKPGDLISPNILAFNERQNVILPVDITVDVPAGTEVDDASDLSPLVIPRGTCIKSHYVHYQPNVTNVANGGVAFDSPILGVAILQSSLDATNFLGAIPPTEYPVALQCAGAAGVDCGMEVPDDLLRVNAQSVQVEFLAHDPGDRIRVIARGNPAICEKLCFDPECR